MIAYIILLFWDNTITNKKFTFCLNLRYKIIILHSLCEKVNCCIYQGYKIMLDNVYLFTWEERFLIDQELQRWISSFSQKFGNDSIFVFNNENRDWWAVNQNIFWGWLFATKKLIILRWIPFSAEKQNWFDTDSVNNFIDKFTVKSDLIPNENLVVFLSYNPDKRWRLYKFLQSNAKIKEFNKFWTIEIKNFLKKYVWDIQFSENDMTYFIDKVWDDLYRINSEIDKLVEYCHVYNLKKIDREIIDQISFGMTETIAFGFMDLLFKDPDKAVQYLDKIKAEWWNRNEFAGALYSQLKMYIMIDDYFQKWIKDQKQIATECNLNPKAVFINFKNIKQISNNWNELRNMYKCLVNLDCAIKSWKIKEDQFRLNIKKMWLKFKV